MRQKLRHASISLKKVSKYLSCHIRIPEMYRLTYVLCLVFKLHRIMLVEVNFKIMRNKSLRVMAAILEMSQYVHI